jgi:transcriptional regulator with XRE-family HTH domain
MEMKKKASTRAAKRASFKSIKERVSRNVRRKRRENGLTQEELADMHGLNLRTLQSIEAGSTDIKLSMLWRLAKAFGVDVEELVKEPDRT